MPQFATHSQPITIRSSVKHSPYFWQIWSDISNFSRSHFHDCERAAARRFRVYLESLFLPENIYFLIFNNLTNSASVSWTTWVYVVKKKQWRSKVAESAVLILLAGHNRSKWLYIQLGRQDYLTCKNIFHTRGATGAPLTSCLSVP